MGLMQFCIMTHYQNSSLSHDEMLVIADQRDTNSPQISHHHLFFILVMLKVQTVLLQRWCDTP